MMKKTTKILLLAIAYALIFLSMCAAFALFALQTVQLNKLKDETDAERAQLQAEIAQAQEESAALEEELALAQQMIADTEALVSTLTQRTQELQTELDEALRYTFDVRNADAGDIVEAEELDPDDLSRYFTVEKIEKGDKVYERIIGKSYVENKDIGLDELRYMKVLHYNFDHKIQVGELIVHAELVADYQDIFQELFKNEYEIYSMYLIDNFWTGDGLESDSASIDKNNTSAFCYRRVAGGSGLSNHALGRAIDINPQQNPYVTFDSQGRPKWSHDNADDYIDRDSGLAHVITHDDLAYKLFKAHGFDWGGDWKTLKDYQHFDKE